jgi:mevalonate pyrophosphate decarboxylase
LRKKLLLRLRPVVLKRKKNSKDYGMRLSKKLKELDREWRRKQRNRENVMKQKLSKNDFV